MDADRSVFPAVRSWLGPRAFRAEIERGYALGPVHHRVHLQGITNDVREATASAVQNALWEVDLLHHLHRNGLPVVPGAARPDRRWVGTIEAAEGLRPVALFACVLGAKPTDRYTEL